MILTEFDRCVLLAIVAGFGCGIFWGILDYIYAKFIQKPSEIKYNYFLRKGIVFSLTCAVIFGVITFVQVSYSTADLSVAKINRENLIFAISLPIINFVCERFFNSIGLKKTE